MHIEYYGSWYCWQNIIRYIVVLEVKDECTHKMSEHQTTSNEPARCWQYWVVSAASGAAMIITYKIEDTSKNILNLDYLLKFKYKLEATIINLKI